MGSITSRESRVETTAVLVVDVQGDFTTWKNGSLAVEDSDEAYIRTVGEATQNLARRGYPIFGTQDWHPADHVSFFSNHPGKQAFESVDIDGRSQILWPPHCVRGTENARILVDNNLFRAVVTKGRDPRYDSYSGFQDDGGHRTELDEILKRNNIGTLIMYGIATDVCVKATAVDAVGAGYRTVVIEGLCRGVTREGAAAALQEMKGKGILIQAGV